jgi:hypothetical protein
MTDVRGRAGIPWEDLDPEIRELVRTLNDLGFPTYHSCSGHRGRADHVHHAPYAAVGFDVQGFAELHRFVAIANATDRIVQRKHPELSFEVVLNWSFEVIFSLDPNEPERLPLVLHVRDLGGEEDRDAAPTPDQLALVATAFRRAGARSKR